MPRPAAALVPCQEEVLRRLLAAVGETDLEASLELLMKLDADFLNRKCELRGNAGSLLHMAVSRAPSLFL